MKAVPLLYYFDYGIGHKEKLIVSNEFTWTLLMFNETLSYEAFLLTYFLFKL